MSGGGPNRSDNWRPVPKQPVKSKSGTGDGGGGEPNPCDITEITNLNSVDRTVLSTVRVGDVLTIVYLVGPPRRLVARTAGGNIVGSITSPSMPQIIQCMTQSNYGYEATVLSIRGALCQVELRPA
jgi:hypothetical protein